MRLSLVISRKRCPPNKYGAVREFLGKVLFVLLISGVIHKCKSLKRCHNETQRETLSVQMSLITLTIEFAIVREDFKLMLLFLLDRRQSNKNYCL